MTLLWTIGKYLLLVLAVLVALLIIFLIGVFVFPIRYYVEGEKGEEIEGQMIVHYAGIVRFSVISEGSENTISLKILGKEFWTPFTKKEVEHFVERNVKEGAEDVTDALADTKPSTTADAIKQQDLPTEKEDLQEKRQKKSIGPIQQCKNIIGNIKLLYKDDNRSAFIYYSFELIKQLLHAIKPSIFRFSLIIGKENPADTGELIAKITMLYPLYHAYGTISGNYIEECVYGDVILKGKFNLWDLVKPCIRYILKRPVRDYIKLMTTIGKEEGKGKKNGEKTKQQ